MMAQQKTPHVRLTVEEVKQGWEQGDYTAAGYLYLLIRASRKDGWTFEINNVRKFCEEFGISRNAFYKAKSKLVNEGRLTEGIGGRVRLTIPDTATVISIEQDTLPVTVRQQVSPNSDSCHPFSGDLNFEDTKCHSLDDELNFEDTKCHSLDDGLNVEDTGTHPSPITSQSGQSIQQLSQPPTDLITTNRSTLTTDPTPPPSENACEDLNLNPNREEGSAPIEFPLSPVQVRKSSPQPELTESQPDPNFPPRENHSQKRSWGTIAPQRTPFKSDTRRFEQQFEELPPWLVGRRWSDLETGFAEYLKTYLPAHIPYFEGKELDMPAIKNWAMKARGSEDRYEGVEIAWDAYQQERAKPQPPPERDIAAIAAADIAAELAKLQGVA